MNEGFHFLLRLMPWAVLFLCIFIVYRAIASGDVAGFMKEAYPVLGGLFIVLVISQAMA
ncbi:hypothetical protein WDK74_22065 [Escherichia coli]